jgi:hypothetical protein
MTAEQLTLDPSPPLAWAPGTGTARHADPATSREAAKSMAEVIGAEQQRVLDALRLLTALDQPTTAGRVTTLLGDRQRSCVARRITDLRVAGLVRDSGETFREDRKGARSETLWELVA